MHGGAAPNLPLDHFAAITSLIDIGRSRDDVLDAAGLSPDGWRGEQEAWLTRMASQVRQQRFDLQMRFNKLLLEMLSALERGERVAVSDSVQLGRRASLGAAIEVPGATAAPISADAGRERDASSTVSSAPPPRAVSSAPPPRAVSSAPPPRAVSSAAEAPPASVRPLPPPPPPPAPADVPPASVRPLPPPPPPAAIAAAPTRPDAALPFPVAAGAPRQAAASPRDGALPFASAASSAVSGSQGAGLPFRAADLVAAPPPVRIEEPHVDLGKTLGPGEVLSPLRSPPPAAPVDLSRTIMATEGAAAATALPFADKRKNVTLPFQAVKPPAGRGGVRGDDGALPFASPAPAAKVVGPPAAAPQEPEGEGGEGDDLSRTLTRGRGTKAKRDEPRLSLEQFASLTAEVGVHPERRAEIEARYGLDAHSHDLEKRAWALIFFDDRSAADRYTAKVKEFRQWLEKGSTA